MSAYGKRAWLDFAISMIVSGLVFYFGTWWLAIFIVLPYGLWNYYDGRTRCDL